MFFDAMTEESGDMNPDAPDNDETPPSIRHLQQQQEQIRQRLTMIETRLGIIYRPKIQLPHVAVDHEADDE